MSKKVYATKSLQWFKGVELLCQLKCPAGPKIMSLSSWGPHIEWLIYFNLSKPKFGLQLLGVFQY